MVFWIIWSGKYDINHLLMGVISCVIVTLWSSDLLVSQPKVGIVQRVTQFFKFLFYFFWLLYQIVVANLQVLKVAFHPRLETVLDPQMVSFKSGMKTRLGQYNLAHSITLTPGTVSVEIEKGAFLVHALTKDAADGVPGDMARYITWVFGGKS